MEGEIKIDLQRKGLGVIDKLKKVLHKNRK